MNKYKLNIADVKNIALSNSVPYITTTKLYYKQFAYNLTLEHINIWHHSNFYSMPDADINEIRQLHRQFCSLYKQFTDMLDKKGIDYRTRKETNFNIYFNDPEVFRLSLKKFRQYIRELRGPQHIEHLDAMRDNRKIVVRENLWYKKYRFKVSYRGTSDFQDNIVPSIMNFRETLTEKEIKLSSNFYKVLNKPMVSNRTGFYRSNYRTFYGVQPWHICSVYLDCEENYVLFKMMVGGEVDSEQEIMLLSELKSDK